VYQNLIKMIDLAHEAEQRNSFFLSLQNTPSLDLRDNRGKTHNMSLVLTSFILSFLRGKDGNLSRIHRAMTKTQSVFCTLLKFDYQPVISRSHLPIFLGYIDVEILESLVFTHFGVQLDLKSTGWFALDGKELRGSILAGHTRGEAVVQVVSHETLATHSQDYYNGSKESERPCVATLLENKDLAAQKLTMDSLHFTPTILDLIAEEGGIFLVGLKGNQSEILTDMELLCKLSKPDYEQYSENKGHGREETRHYKTINLAGEYFDKRWEKAKFQTLIHVKRTRLENKRGKFSSEISYYMSNYKPQTKEQAEELFKAIRGHWAVETNNNIRDVTLKEDSLTTIIKPVSIVTSIIRTLVINMLQIIKPKNMIAQLENFGEDLDELETFIKQVGFL
jgi:hypothetical protein